MDSREQQIRHLEMIQDVIRRMTVNSFLLKGWSVVLASAMFALAAAGAAPGIALVALVPALVFWSLDAFYLRQERLFRLLYDSVRSASSDETDFDMRTGAFKAHVPSPGRLAFTRTVGLFHGVIASAIMIATIVMWCSQR